MNEPNFRITEEQIRALDQVRREMAASRVDLGAVGESLRQSLSLAELRLPSFTLPESVGLPGVALAKKWPEVGSLFKSFDDVAASMGALQHDADRQDLFVKRLDDMEETVRAQSRALAALMNDRVDVNGLADLAETLRAQSLDLAASLGQPVAERFDAIAESMVRRHDSLLTYEPATLPDELVEVVEEAHAARPRPRGSTATDVFWEVVTLYGGLRMVIDVFSWLLNLYLILVLLGKEALVQ